MSAGARGRCPSRRPTLSKPTQLDTRFTPRHDGTEKHVHAHARAHVHAYRDGPRVYTRAYTYTYIHTRITHARERRAEEVVEEVVPDGGGCDGDGPGRFAPNRKCPAPKPRSSIPFVPASSRTHVPRPEVAATHRPPPTYDNLLLPRGPPLEPTATEQRASSSCPLQPPRSNF